jgi:tetratricopeptide (TPR) repeat protein
VVEAPQPAELRDLEAEDPPAASLWHEVRADAFFATGDAEQCRFALSAAARHATGIRRATLLRRLADLQLDAGQPDAAIVTLQQLTGALVATPAPQGPKARAALDALQPSRTPSHRWDALSPDAAQAFTELARAEALSHLVRSEEAARAFSDAEPKLRRLGGPVAAEAWVRWAQAQTWFLCEILGDARAALQVCARVRTHVPKDLLEHATHAFALLRAEEVAASSAGDFPRAKALLDEQIALASTQGNRRDECLARNARGLLHLSEGELDAAKAALERSRALAVEAKWPRREAIAMHNLALVACEHLALEEAESLERRYAKLSAEIGNEAAQAEAPLVLAGVELARGKLDAADALIASARKVSQARGWVMLQVQARALAGRSCLLHYAQTRDPLDLPKARTHLLTAIDVLEEHTLAWSEELDPGETYALFALALARSGQTEKATAALKRAEQRISTVSVVSRAALELGAAAVRGGPIDSALKWFDDRGYRRVGALWRTLTRASSPPA